MWAVIRWLSNTATSTKSRFNFDWHYQPHVQLKAAVCSNTDREVDFIFCSRTNFLIRLAQLHSIWHSLQQGCLFYQRSQSPNSPWLKPLFHYFPLISPSNLPLAHRGRSSRRSAKKFTSTQSFVQLQNWGSKLTLRFMAGISITSFLFLLLKLLFHLLKGLHESPEQVSHFLRRLLNSSPLLCSAWKHEPCDSSLTASHVTPFLPPRAALFHFLLCRHALSRPHEHQCRPEDYSFNFSFQFLSTPFLYWFDSIFNCINE